jgi:magnesium transporter
MISVFAVREGVLRPLPGPADPAMLPADALWIDLMAPTPEEEAGVERLLGVGIPTREEMTEIEESARLYEERGALVMTAVVVTGVSEHRRPATAEVTFVLTPKMLVTVRYADPLPFRTFAAKCERQPEAHDTSDLVFLSLVENVVNRLADVLEAITRDLDTLSGEIFADGDANEHLETGPPTKGRARRRPPTDLQAVVKRLGRANALLVKLRESLLSVGRLLAYYRHGAGDRLRNGTQTLLQTLDRDARSLADYDAQLSAQVAFLLEATLGLVGAEQNRIIKVFSVAAVLFLPPTLVGTVYGMNFEHMPELGWTFGYPLALALMVASAVAPYYWFKHKGWL